MANRPKPTAEMSDRMSRLEKLLNGSIPDDRCRVAVNLGYRTDGFGSRNVVVKLDTIYDGRRTPGWVSEGADFDKAFSNLLGVVERLGVEWFDGEGGYRFLWLPPFKSLAELEMKVELGCRFLFEKCPQS